MHIQIQFARSSAQHLVFRKPRQANKGLVDGDKCSFRQAGEGHCRRTGPNHRAEALLTFTIALFALTQSRLGFFPFGNVLRHRKQVRLTVNDGAFAQGEQRPQTTVFGADHEFVIAHDAFAFDPLEKGLAALLTRVDLQFVSGPANGFGF